MSETDKAKTKESKRWGPCAVCPMKCKYPGQLCLIVAVVIVVLYFVKKIFIG